MSKHISACTTGIWLFLPTGWGSSLHPRLWAPADLPFSIDLPFDPLYTAGNSHAAWDIMALIPVLVFALGLTTSLKYTECLCVPLFPSPRPFHPCPLLQPLPEVHQKLQGSPIGEVPPRATFPSSFKAAPHHIPSEAGSILPYPRP